MANADPVSCFDRTAAVTVSEQRLNLAVPQELLRRSGFDRFAPRFERVLCSVRGTLYAYRDACVCGRSLSTASLSGDQRSLS
ncbi:hypothetical protein ACFQ1S_22880 [Kibdelosporangium lantanae]|uniref:Uncharacterized protein n=1 Tax=Kibdelosporangium lantanae TaxID=1497396 RepID=A0ABW3MEX9_9PSEU